MIHGLTPEATERLGERSVAYFLYLIEAGGLTRYDDPTWLTDERSARIAEEASTIIELGFEKAFIMLADVMAYAVREKIPIGPGRGSVGGCYTAYLMGIHELDSIEFGLLFERFLNKERVSFPDIDLDFSQRDRQRIIDYVVAKYNRDDQVVLQVPAFARASGRAIVETMASVMSQTDPEAYAIATNLKKCFPEKGSITGGVKAPRELDFWLNKGGGHGDKDKFRQIATEAGWLDTMLKIDSYMTHLGKHAAGVVILGRDDLKNMPLTSANGETMMAGYDMYSLDDLKVLKWDFLGLRTVDVIFDAFRFSGGDGTMAGLMKVFYENRNDPRPYQELAERPLGMFQIDTAGFSRTIRDFQPTTFEHIVQLGALYRPGALDYRREEDGKNMVEVFIERHHGREDATFDVPSLRPILQDTYGILLFQEQQMKVAQVLAGFTLKQADSLRKAIGKKRPEEMAKLVPLWNEGIAKNSEVTEAMGNRWWENIEKAARYSWNRSHAAAYGLITWFTAWFKAVHPAAFYAALLNSYEDDKNRMADTIAEARQRVSIRPPDVNVAMADFIVDEGEIVFGFNGIKGMGDSYRSAILANRAIYGPFKDFADFSLRLPSLPISIKTSLVACGAFDRIDNRTKLLSQVPKGKGEKKWIVTMACTCTRKVPKEVPADELQTIACQKKAHQGMPNHGISIAQQEEVERWTVAEHVNHNRTLKNPKPIPPPMEWIFPSDMQLAAGEMEAMGFYITAAPLQDVQHDLDFYGQNVVGGEIERVNTKVDKRGQEMAWATIITPALTKKRLTIFGSVWPTVYDRVTKGKRLLFRGRVDGDGFLVDACWEPGDFRHIKKLRITRGDEEQKLAFDGDASVIRRLESEGYAIRCL